MPTALGAVQCHCPLGHSLALASHVLESIHNPQSLLPKSVAPGLLGISAQGVQIWVPDVCQEVIQEQHSGPGVF